MASRLRIGTALLGAMAALSFSALSASAAVIIEPYPHDSPTYKNRETGHNVWLKPVGNVNDPNKLEHQTSLIPLKIKDAGEVTKVVAYCVELPTPLADDDGLKEAPWGTHPNKKSKFPENAGHVLWLLHNSYPTLDIKTFQKKWGAKFDEMDAIAATQAAIWTLTDDAQIDEKHPQNDDDVLELYPALVKEAKANSITEQPKPTLEIAPESKSGTAGELIGPFKVTTTAEEIELTANLPEGVTITDANGKPFDTTKDKDASVAKGIKGTEFFVKVAAGTAKGEAKLKVKAEALIKTGRLFVTTDQHNEAQSLVVAQDHKAKVEKKAKADWKEGVKPSEPTTPPTTTTTEVPPTTTTTTPAPAPAPGGSGDEDLASTGASILWPLVGGLVLVGGGVAALFIVRRKKAGA